MAELAISAAKVERDFSIESEDQSSHISGLAVIGQSSQERVM